MKVNHLILVTATDASERVLIINGNVKGNKIGKRFHSLKCE